MTDLIPIDIIDNLLSEVGFDFAQDLQGDDIVAGLISCSGSVGWGLDTYDILQAWPIEPGICFLVDIYLDGEPDDETSILGTSILVQVKGKAVKKSAGWEVSEYELVEADYYPPNDYLDENQLEAILSNTEFYRTFSDEISSLRLLNLINVDRKALNTLKKQIYIGAITCLETYLSDAFINTVLSDEKYLISFFFTFKDFKDQKFGMNELFIQFDKAEEIAKKAMLEVIYHKFTQSKQYV